jgi:hypothetical protein
VPYRVLVEERFRRRADAARRELGAFETLEAAVAAARRVVDEYLLSAHRPGMRSDELFAGYAVFGRDPAVADDGGDLDFSALEYALERCRALCAPPGRPVA